MLKWSETFLNRIFWRDLFPFYIRVGLGYIIAIACTFPFAYWLFWDTETSRIEYLSIVILFGIGILLLYTAGTLYGYMTLSYDHRVVEITDEGIRLGARTLYKYDDINAGVITHHRRKYRLRIRVREVSIQIGIAANIKPQELYSYLTGKISNMRFCDDCGNPFV